jgi:Tfp pilus assembly protein PilV
MLIEVMVGALLLGMASTAILNGLDGAQETEKQNQVRSVQSTLAQQDIERMRSMPVTSLTNLNQTRTVAVAGVNYTVLSTTAWVSDASGQVSCSDANAGAEYLKLSSKVTSPGSKHNVTETALLSPGLGQLNATLGLATVKLVDRSGNPIAGKTVNLSGASSQTKTTNSLGCAVFGYITAGSYTASVPGYVEMASNGTANDPLVVYKGRASFGQMQVDVPASVKATFVPPSGNTFFSPATNVTSDDITVMNANLVPSSKVFAGTSANTLTASSCVGPPASSACGLFPFLDGVNVYAGSCAANNPASYAGQTNYFSTSGRGFTNLGQGQVGAPVNVEMPTLRVNVTRQTVSGSVPSWFRTQVLITSLDSGCTVTAYQNQPADRATNLNSTVTFDAAVPYGNYRICAYTRGRTSGTSGTTLPAATTVDRRYITSATAGSNPTNPTDQNLTNAPATANRQITITTPTSSTGGVCF